MLLVGVLVGIAVVVFGVVPWGPEPPGSKGM
jgi:hypothetical protein